MTLLVRRVDLFACCPSAEQKNVKWSAVLPAHMIVPLLPVLHAVNQRFLPSLFIPPSAAHLHIPPLTDREEHAARRLLRHPEHGGAEQCRPSLP